MTPRRMGTGITIIVVAVVVVLIMATIAFAVFASPTATSISQTTSSTTSSTSTTSTVHPLTNSTTSTQGLQLTESVNASTITVGRSVNISIFILNTIPTVNTILPLDDWSFQGVGTTLWGACVGSYPVEVAVLSGNYTIQELQSVANSTFQYTCAGYVSVNQVIFQPHSDQVNITGSGPGPGLNQTLGPFHLTVNFTVNGYWNLKSLSQEPNLPIVGAEGRAPSSTAFVPGIYTVAVEDEWGQAIVLHVAVDAES